MSIWKRVLSDHTLKMSKKDWNSSGIVLDFDHDNNSVFLVLHLFIKRFKVSQVFCGILNNSLLNSLIIAATLRETSHAFQTSSSL